jgi:uncharacterized membrane protein
MYRPAVYVFGAGFVVLVLAGVVVLLRELLTAPSPHYGVAMSLIVFGCFSGVVAWSAWTRDNRSSFEISVGDGGDAGGGDGGGGGGD